jgi:hypothetical protein
MIHPVESRSLTVDFLDNSFIVRSVPPSVEICVETPLLLDSGFEGREFDVHTLALRDLHENSILEVNLGGQRIGLTVPANALASNDHDHASKMFFRQCAYVIMKKVLKDAAPSLRSRLESADLGLPVLFSDLFHDNVCFLLLDKAALRSFDNFHFDRLLPSLAFRGFIPIENCDPDALVWRSALPEHKKLHVSLVSGDVDGAHIVARLYILAAMAGPSKLLQFFYLYQIIEHLLEAVLRHRLPQFARAMMASLAVGASDLHDEFLIMNEQMRERVRLKLLVNDYAECRSSLDELGAAASALLNALHLREQFGIDAVYAVRNFLFHRARNLPAEDEGTLDAVVEAFAEFVPVLLATFALPTAD